MVGWATRLAPPLQKGLGGDDDLREGQVSLRVGLDEGHQENVYFLDLNLSAFFYIFTYFTILFDNLRDFLIIYKT